jgi:hypothetical protein
MSHDLSFFVAAELILPVCVPWIALGVDGDCLALEVWDFFPALLPLKNFIASSSSFVADNPDFAISSNANVCGMSSLNFPIFAVVLKDIVVLVNDPRCAVMIWANPQCTTWYFFPFAKELKSLSLSIYNPRGTWSLNTNILCFSCKLLETIAIELVDIIIIIDDKAITVLVHTDPHGGAVNFRPAKLKVVDWVASSLLRVSNDVEISIGANANVISSSRHYIPASACVFENNLLLVCNIGESFWVDAYSHSGTWDFIPTFLFLVPFIYTEPTGLCIGADDPDLSTSTANVVGSSWHFVPTFSIVPEDISRLVHDPWVSLVIYRNPHSTAWIEYPFVVNSFVNFKTSTIYFVWNDEDRSIGANANVISLSIHHLPIIAR